MITRRERLEKAIKRLRNSIRRGRGEGVPILIFGEQRSGTNMLLRCFDRCPDTDIYNETDDDAFHDYELREFELIRKIVENSRASHVVFKPTVDGNRALEIIEALPRTRAIWIYRDYRDAVSSALALFRETSLEYLGNVASRSPLARWRAINVTDADIAFIKGQLDRGICEVSARALIWAFRNSFYFRQRLDTRPDVLLLNYETLVRHPEKVVSRAFTFVKLPFHERYTRSVFNTSVGRRPAPSIDPQIEEFCQRVLSRLEERHRIDHGSTDAAS